MELGRRTFLQGSVALGSIAANRAAADPSLRWAQGSGGKPRPNILLVVLDDVGFADLGCFGSELLTPAIDALAASGVRLNAFHTAPLCTPTRASLLTGRNPHSVGAGVIADWADARPGYRGEIAIEVPTLPELLKQQGYACYAAGKWHLNAIRAQGTTGPFNQWPTHRGFDNGMDFRAPTPISGIRNCSRAPPQSIHRGRRTTISAPISSSG